MSSLSLQSSVSDRSWAWGLARDLQHKLLDPGKRPDSSKEGHFKALWQELRRKGRLPTGFMEAVVTEGDAGDALEGKVNFVLAPGVVHSKIVGVAYGHCNEYYAVYGYNRTILRKEGYAYGLDVVFGTLQDEVWDVHDITEEPEIDDTSDGHNGKNDMHPSFSVEAIYRWRAKTENPYVIGKRPWFQAARVDEPILVTYKDPVTEDLISSIVLRVGSAEDDPVIICGTWREEADSVHQTPLPRAV